MRRHRIRENKKRSIQRISMKKLIKIPAVAAVILSLATTGVSSARAGGWPVAAGAVGGFAVGTMVGRAVAYCPPPAYYVYPPRVYVAPWCAPAPVIVAPAPVCCVPAPLVYPYYYPPVRLGYFAARPHYLRRW
jgi:hypothetical protein